MALPHYYGLTAPWSRGRRQVLSRQRSHRPHNRPPLSSSLCSPPPVRPPLEHVTVPLTTPSSSTTAYVYTGYPHLPLPPQHILAIHIYVTSLTSSSTTAHRFQTMSMTQKYIAYTRNWSPVLVRLPLYHLKVLPTVCTYMYTNVTIRC